MEDTGLPEPFDESQWATRFDPEEIPELFIAVEHRYRGLGVGRRLLRTVLVIGPTFCNGQST